MHFEWVTHALMPGIKVIALRCIWDFNSCEKLLAYCGQYGIVVERKRRPVPSEHALDQAVFVDLMCQNDDIVAIACIGTGFF